MRPAELVHLTLQVLPDEMSPVDLLPPAIVVSLVALGRLLLRFRQQSDDIRDRSDASTWQRMEKANELLAGQLDDAIRQIEQRDERIRQLAEHITELEQRNAEQRDDLRDALKQIHHTREEPS